MDYTDEILADAAAELTDDGDTYELPDGRTLRLEITPDEGMNYDDADFYGPIAWINDRETNDYGHPAARPAGFDGNAEKIHVGRGYDAYWWQPPKDVPRTSEHFAGLRQALLDLLEYGYSVAIVELTDGEDRYGHPIVRGNAVTGGIEPSSDGLDPSYVRDLVEDAIADAESSHQEVPD